MSEKKKTFNYEKDWNVEDFYGKYHLSRIKNKVHPIPGTQIKAEQDHIRKKNDIKKMKEEETIRLQEMHKHKLKIKRETAEVQARVYLAAIISDPMEKAEEVIDLKEKYMQDQGSSFPKNNQGEILRFFQNVKLGRSHYISYAIVGGYKSIDWQEHEFGNTALHVASSLGHLEVVKELLKHKANPDIRNRLGDFPLHQCWLFWKYSDDKNIQIKQQEQTTSILSAILCSGAHSDCQQLDGCTPLHTAARLGPLSAVKALLGHQADHLKANHSGQTPHDVAIACGHADIARLFEMWNDVKRAMIHIDYTVRWRNFLADYESPMTSNTPSAAQVLFEQYMHANTTKLDQEGRQAEFLIDDPLLVEAKESNAAVSEDVQTGFGWLFGRTLTASASPTSSSVVGSLDGTSPSSANASTVGMDMRNTVIDRPDTHMSARNGTAFGKTRRLSSDVMRCMTSSVVSPSSRADPRATTASNLEGISPLPMSLPLATTRSGTPCRSPSATGSPDGSRRGSASAMRRFSSRSLLAQFSTTDVGKDLATFMGSAGVKETDEEEEESGGGTRSHTPFMASHVLSKTVSSEVSLM